MTPTQQNVMQTIRNLAATLLTAKHQIDAASKMWTTENMASLTDENFASHFDFTAAEAQNAKNALDAILTSLGDYSSASSNASKLIKICDTVP